MSNITLKSQRFDKNKFNETIDTKFTQLSSTLNPAYFDRDEAEQKDVFILYDMFRGIIPKFGDTESHLYIGCDLAGELLFTAEKQSTLVLFNGPCVMTFLVENLAFQQVDNVTILFHNLLANLQGALSHVKEVKFVGNLSNSQI